MDFPSPSLIRFNAISLFSPAYIAVIKAFVLLSISPRDFAQYVSAFKFLCPGTCVAYIPVICLVFSTIVVIIVSNLFTFSTSCVCIAFLNASINPESNTPVCVAVPINCPTLSRLFISKA